MHLIIKLKNITLILLYKIVPLNYYVYDEIPNSNLQLIHLEKIWKHTKHYHHLNSYHSDHIANKIDTDIEFLNLPILPS